MRRPEQQPSLRNRPPAHRRIAYIHDASRMILQGRFAPRLTQLKKGYDSLPARPPRDANDTPCSPAQWKEIPASSSSCRRTREWILACGHARGRDTCLAFMSPLSLVMAFGFTRRGTRKRVSGSRRGGTLFFRTLVLVVALCVPLESARNTASEAEHIQARWKTERSGDAVRYALHETGYRLLILRVRNDLYLLLSLSFSHSPSFSL